MHRRRHTIRLPIAVLLATFLAGCGDQGTTVRGKVVLDNQPLAFADVVFYPEDGVRNRNVFGGKTGPEGAFELVAVTPDGVAPGKYRVVVTKYVAKDGSPLPPEEALMKQLEGKAKSAAPPTYATPEKTPLRADVNPGSNSVELTLTTSGKARK